MINWELITGLVCGFGAVFAVAFFITSCEMSNQKMISEYRAACINNNGTYIRDNHGPGSAGGHCIILNPKK